MRLSALLLSSAAVLAAVPALAQDQVTTPAETTQTTTSTAAAAVDPNPEPANAGDIVVTATRRSERLADVPIAVSAVSQATLQNSGANDIRQLTQLAPSLSVSSTGSEANASARIRGIGTVGDNPGLESSVVTFIDGVYRSRTGAGLNDIGEIDRVEVLRGPQGTLSGRNSSAGAINIYTKAPSQEFGGYLEGTYGNFDNIRVAGALTGPIVRDLLAFRVDGVYAKRDGFYRDVVNDTDFNNRDRYFVRGQLLFEPTSDLSVRLLADYTRRDEKCCGAVYVDTREKIDPTPGVPGDFAINPAGNRIVQVMQSLGAVFPSAGDPYNRRIAQTPGRNYSNITKDYGASAQVDWNFGNAALTSITAYREYKAAGAGDIDYGNLDLVYRPNNGNAFRRFRTFTQELRLNGEAFGDRLNWLVGGFYSNERLRVVDNLRFGRDYGAFAACRVVASANPAAVLRGPRQPGCLSATGRAVLSGAVPGTTPAFGAATPLILAGLDRLSTLSDLGSVRDVYDQKSESFAAFTHNVLRITDTLSLTGGLRWTKEKKRLDASFTNDNTVCRDQLTSLAPLLANPALASTVAGILTLSCTGNSSSTLSGKRIRDRFSDDEFTGTAVLSWKPIQDLMTYASYSRGFKAGGFNLDRSDLGAAFLPATTANPSARALRFDAETVNSYELGVKYSSRAFSFNAAAFRSDFSDFQLNTFNGTNFVVQNLASCDDDLNGADRDNSAATGRCGSDTGTGVRSQGVELEAGFYPARNFAVNLGYTFADTKVRNNIVDSSAGGPLDPALFLLPGAQLPLAPRNVVTSSASWTPELSGDLKALFYVDQRTTSDFNTGSDNFREKAQDGFTVVNARVGLSGRDALWAIEFWAQNVFDTDYQQVAFNAPFQGAGSVAQVQQFGAPSFAAGNQIFTSFLAEPRTYGVTLRTRF